MSELKHPTVLRSAWPPLRTLGEPTLCVCLYVRELEQSRQCINFTRTPASLNLKIRAIKHSLLLCKQALEDVLLKVCADGSHSILGCLASENGTHREYDVPRWWRSCITCGRTEGRCHQTEMKVRLCSACLSRTCVLLLVEAWLGILHSGVLQLNELPVDERQKKTSLRETNGSESSSCFATRSGSADPSTADL